MNANEKTAETVIQVAGTDLEFRTVAIGDATPTGHQIAHAAGAKPPDDALVLRMLSDGALDPVRPDEVVDLREGDGRFVVGLADRISLIEIDGERHQWIGGVISGAVLRRLGDLSDDAEILLERVDRPDREIGLEELVSLDREGIESFISRKKEWKLNVHGVIVEFAVSSVKVRDALTEAKFDPDKGWQIYLKVAGQPKREVALDEVIDLRTPGIEKLRLMPRDVNNGEAPARPRQAFALLEEDGDYLDRLGLAWETVVERGKRWLLISGYPLPEGYTAATTTLALLIPPTYPQAQIYGFFAHPAIALASGRVIQRTQLAGSISGRNFVGWSRYRANQPWNPEKDSVVTQLGLVEACLLKELGQ